MERNLTTGSVVKNVLSFLHNIISISLVRVPGAYLASKLFPATLFPMGIATVKGSFLSIIICMIAYIMINRRKDIRYNI